MASLEYDTASRLRKFSWVALNFLDLLKVPSIDKTTLKGQLDKAQAELSKWTVRRAQRQERYEDLKVRA